MERIDADWLDRQPDPFEATFAKDWGTNGIDRGPQTFKMVDLAAWATSEPEPRQWALDRYVPKGEVTLFTGPGGVGKSLFAQQLATCHAAGLPMLGTPTAGGATLYLTAEDDERELHWRQKHVSRAVRASIAGLAGKLHLASLRGRLNNELATFDASGVLEPTPAYELLRATIKASGASLVVLDNVAHLFVGNENDRGQVTAFANLLNGLCRAFGTTIILVAHPNKAGDDYSGSTAWLNAVRSQITLKKPEEDHDADARVLTLGKANYARQGEQLAFRWHDFAFIREDDLPSDARAELAANAQAGAENSAFLKCLALSTEQRRAVSHNPGVNYFGTVFTKMTEGKKYNREAYERAFERLLHLGEIELDAPLWQDTHRHWKQGIRAAEKCGNPPAATPCGDLRQPPSQVIEKPMRAARAATPLYTTYKGAASKAAAPTPKSDLSRVVFPPDSGDVGDPNTWGADQ